MSSTRELAQAIRERATSQPLGDLDRAAGFCAAICLDRASSTATAKKRLREWAGPDDIRSRAIEIVAEHEAAQ